MDIAIIPARGGSKRISGKNIKNFCGKPIIAYSIEAAQASGVFDAVVVSTDDPEIRDVATSYGAMAPFMRKSSLSDDYTPTVPVIVDAIEQCQALGWDIDYVACVYATGPFILPEDIKMGKKNVSKHKGVYSFPVSAHHSPVQRSLVLEKGGRTRPMFPEHELVRTQDLKATYFDVGQFYFAHCETWKQNQNIHLGAVPVIIPKWRAVDIDDEEDWERAEGLYISTSNLAQLKGS